MTRDVSYVEFSEASDPYLRPAIVVSCVLHIALGYLAFFKLNPQMGDLTPPVIYSVTLEGGKNIGGIDQVPQKEKTPVAPPKNVSSDRVPTPEEVKPEKSKPKEEKAPDDAEVSLKEKEKPTPTARPSATPKKADSPKPTAKTTPKPTPKVVTQAELDKDYQKAMQRYLGESTNAGGKGFGAAVLGGSGMGGGAQISAEEKAYYLALQAHVKRGWRWYDTNVPYVAEVTFKISPSGEISEVQLRKGSGVREFDDSVLRALAKANPVPRPPQRVYHRFSFVKMTFNPRE